MKEEKDSAGVIIPPPLIYLAALICGLTLERFFPQSFLPPFFRLAGAPFVALAVWIVASALLIMFRAKTNPEPWKPTTTIVKNGVYGWTRNPMYLSFSLFYAGLALLFDSLWTLALLLPVLFVIHNFVILREEKYLARKFGEEYLNYQTRVRRWL